MRVNHSVNQFNHLSKLNKNNKKLSFGENWENYVCNGGGTGKQAIYTTEAQKRLPLTDDKTGSYLVMPLSIGKYYPDSRSYDVIGFYNGHTKASAYDLCITSEDTPVSFQLADRPTDSSSGNNVSYLP